MPLLVLLPGMDGSGTLFQPLLNCFSGESLVISYPQQTWTYQSLAQWVYQQLPKDRPLILLAESFSGPVAYLIACERPTNLVGVIFVATFMGSPRSFLTQVACRLPWYFIFNLKLPDLLTKKLLLGSHASPKLIEQFWQVVKKLSPSIVAHRLYQIANLDLPDIQINIPCLYVSASNDRLVPANQQQAFALRCPNLISICLHGPHFLLQAEPLQCTKIIEEFLHQEKI